MPHIKVDTPRIGEESPIAGRLIMPAMVQIQHTSPLDLEEMVTDLMGKPCRRMVRPILVDQESVFSLQTKDTIQHEITRVMGSDPSEASFATHRPSALDIWRGLARDDQAKRIRLSFRQCTDADAYRGPPHQSPADQGRSLLRHGLGHPPVLIVALDHRPPTHEPP